MRVDFPSPVSPVKNEERCKMLKTGETYTNANPQQIMALSKRNYTKAT